MAATEVSPRQDGDGCGMGQIGRKFMTCGDIGDGSAVGDNISVELPFVLQSLMQKQFAGAGRGSIDGVVSAHDAVGVGVDDKASECGKIRVGEIVRGDDGVEGVARDSGPAVNREVFCRGNDLEIARIRTLQTLHKGGADAAGEKRIFAVGFLSASPARVAIDVDIGRPEGEAIVDGVLPSRCAWLYFARASVEMVSAT